VIDGDGGAETGVSGGAEGLEPEGGEGGRFTEALVTSLKYQTFSSLGNVLLRAGKDSGFECLR